jgi:hypothetical protein
MVRSYHPSLKHRPQKEPMKKFLPSQCYDVNGYLIFNLVVRIGNKGFNLLGKSFFIWRKVFTDAKSVCKVTRRLKNGVLSFETTKLSQ